MSKSSRVYVATKAIGDTVFLSTIEVEGHALEKRKQMKVYNNCTVKEAIETDFQNNCSELPHVYATDKHKSALDNVFLNKAQNLVTRSIYLYKEQKRKAYNNYNNNGGR